MSDEEFNSAEQEAEEILKQEFARIDMDGEDCPAGEDCAVHHRVNEELLNDKEEYGRIITYAGDYVVISSDNPALTSPSFILGIMLGKVTKDDIPSMYETCVIHVGDGPVGEVRTLSREDQLNAIRFIQLHDEWTNFKAAHDMIVEAVKNNSIDLSKPAHEEKF